MDDEFGRCRWCHRGVAIDEEFCSDVCEDEYTAEWEELSGRGGQDASGGSAAMGEAAEIPQRIKWVKGDPVPEFPEECEPHTPQPSGYLQWHAWAERMAKTHDQRQCRGCGLWAVWEPQAAVTVAREQASRG